MGSSQDLSPSATVATPKSAATIAGRIVPRASWPRPATPTDLVPAWAGEFCSFDDWVNFATQRLTGTTDPLMGGQVQSICIDAFGRRCTMGAHFMRARDEGAFPVRFFWDCFPSKATGQEVTASGDELAREGSASGMNPEKGAARKPLAVGDKVRAAAGDVLEVVALKRKSPTCGEEYAVWDEDSGYSAVPASDVESWERVQ